jgi:nitroimidazol reductase NimA-like FMN-containing flavoprotein (pyridoxamine 5'-phosphate oxidase superfamily)
MDHAECLRRLGTVHIGRVGITVDALPIILPVNFVLVDERVLFRTSAGTKLDAATSESVVAFEADAYSPDGAAGWSVLVVGRSRHVDSDERVAALAEELLSKRWSPARRADHLVEIEASYVTGRRFGDVKNPWLLLH